MMSNKGDSQKRIQCPYDPAHIILQHRMQTHLVKCRRNYPEKKMVICMHNSTHQVPEPELAFHLETCCDRVGLDKFMYATSSSADEKFPVPTLNLEPTETWDDDFHPTYDPEEHCMNNPILRNKNTLSQAERRKFRMEERQRMQKFEKKPEEKELPKELQQPQGEKSHRRPVMGSSGGSIKSVLLEDDISHMLMTRVKLGTKTVTVPLSNPNVTMPSSPDANCNVVEPKPHEDMKNDFSKKMQGSTQAPKKTVSRGRGSSLVQNN